MHNPPANPRRKSIRLQGYDYAQAGGYFLTITLQDRLCILGDIENAGMRLSDAGRLVEQAWYDLPNHYAHLLLDAFVVMPNHVHGILFLLEPDCPEIRLAVPDTPNVAIDRPGAGLKPAPTHHGLPEVVRGFKTFSARRINALMGFQGQRVWQRSYYEHIIRSAHDLQRIRAYIEANPANWQTDENFPH